MRIKQRPEDFSVKESYRFDKVENGPFRVYLMDKQKLSTFDAVERLRERFGLRPGAISFCGLKDKQGRTEQIIAVDGFDVDMQEDDLRLKYLGRTDRPLSAANITSNRFSVTVRGLSQGDFPKLSIAAAEVSRLGVVNYFDSQRFGSLKHGQGFIAKDLIRGDFEAALHNYMAKPSELDRSEDHLVKDFWRKHWGKWGAKAPFAGNKKYFRVLAALRESPHDFVRAFLQIDSSYRAMLLFTYQSYLWNEAVRRLLQILLPRESLFPMPYQAGTLLHHRDAPPEVLTYLRELSFPLLGPDSGERITDPKIREAVTWAMGKEKLQFSDLRIEEAPQLLFFKHEDRPLLVTPQKLVLGKAQRDELSRDSQKLNIAFTLPPGSYATLVVKRLFHWTYAEDTAEQIKETQAWRPPEEGDAKPHRQAHRPSAGPAKRLTPAPRGTGGFRERQALKKAQKAQARADNRPQSKEKKT
ncbi:MAG: tRNA pseudouridine(13) synthase TruD [Myxococcaceae bacterium]